MWQKILENIKIVLGSITAIAVFATGVWTLTTNIFMTKAEAQQLEREQKAIIKKIDLDTAYNKAFRLETRIKKYRQKQSKTSLDDFDKRMLKRLEKDLSRTENRIDVLEQKIYE